MLNVNEAKNNRNSNDNNSFNWTVITIFSQKISKLLKKINVFLFQSDACNHS